MTDQTTAPPPAARPDRPTTGPFLIALAAATLVPILAAVGNHGAQPSPLTPQGVGYLFGAALFGGGLPYLVLRFAVLRHGSRPDRWGYLAILVGWSIALTFIIGVAGLGARRVALTNEMVRFQAEVARDREAIAARSAAIAPSLTISPDTAGPDRRFRVTREAIAEGRRIIADQRALIARLVHDERARLLALSPEAAQGFDRGFAASRARMDAQINASVANLDELTATLDFLDRIHDRWSIRNGEWLFRTQADLDELNRHGERLRRMVSDTRALQDQAEAARRASEERIDQLAHPGGGKP